MKKTLIFLIFVFILTSCKVAKMNFSYCDTNELHPISHKSRFVSEQYFHPPYQIKFSKEFIEINGMRREVKNYTYDRVIESFFLYNGEKLIVGETEQGMIVLYYMSNNRLLRFYN